MPDNRYQTLLPRPTQAQPATGEFIIDETTTLRGDAEAVAAVRLLLTPLGLPLSPGDATGGITAAVDPAVAGPEGYQLTVTADGIEIRGSDVDGVRNGVQTLRQLLPDAAWRQASPTGTVWNVPCGRIVDAPALSWRGGMLDVSRHFLPKRTMLRYIDLFAMHHLNRLHLHLTDDQGWRIESHRHPRLHEVGAQRPYTQVRWRTPEGDGTPHGGYYTLDDLAEIHAYGAARGVTVVPEIDVPGHSSALLAAYPEFGFGHDYAVLTGGGVTGSTMSPLPDAVAFLQDVLDELLEAMPTPFVHLGGDECDLTDWEQDERVAAYLKQIGGSSMPDLHGHFLHALADHLGTRGVRMVAWDEAYITGGLGADSIVAAWRGDGVADRAARDGYDVIRCPVVPTYLNFDQSDDPDEPISQGGPITLAEVAGFPPVIGSTPEHILGLQFQAWSEYIDDERHLDYLLFPRGAVLADIAWRGEPIPGFDAEQMRPHLARLDAAGVEYRPLEGGRPWQRGGTGDRRRQQTESIEQTRAFHEELTETGRIHYE